MFRFWNIFVLLLSGFILLAPPLKAEGNTPKMMTSSPTAKLYRVDEGIFDIKLGQVLDLTDRKVLMAFSTTMSGNNRTEIKRNQSFWVSFNSSSVSFSLGKRLNLKSKFNDIFKDKDECYLDLIGIATPKGAPVIATFRFHCE
jgi:hypothetical protein